MTDKPKPKVNVPIIRYKAPPRPPKYKPKRKMLRAPERKRVGPLRRPAKPCKSGERLHCYHIHEAHMHSPEERLLVCCHCGRAKATRGKYGPHGVYLSPALLCTTGIDRRTDPKIVNREPYKHDHEAGTQPRTHRRNHRPALKPQ